MRSQPFPLKQEGIIHAVRMQNISKNSYPLICTRTCAYQVVRNVSLSENFAYVLNEWSQSGFTPEYNKLFQQQKLEIWMTNKDTNTVLFMNQNGNCRLKLRPNGTLLFSGRSAINEW